MASASMAWAAASSARWRRSRASRRSSCRTQRSIVGILQKSASPHNPLHEAWGEIVIAFQTNARAKQLRKKISLRDAGNVRGDNPSRCNLTKLELKKQNYSLDKTPTID